MENRSTNVDRPTSADTREQLSIAGVATTEELFERVISEFSQWFKLEPTDDMVIWLRRELQSLGELVKRVYEQLNQTEKLELSARLTREYSRKVSEFGRQIHEKDATLAGIKTVFGREMEYLATKAQQDPKTKLWNFEAFLERLEWFLAEEQRSRWCAVGVVDIASFKWYNDHLGHAVGDKIIKCIARLLCEQVRSPGMLTQQRRAEARDVEQDRRLVHSRFGGDEFCFLIPDLVEYQHVHPIGNRFREAVAKYDWSVVNPDLANKPPRVDVGVVCLQLGPVSDRREVAKKLPRALFTHADQQMYFAKNKSKTEGVDQISLTPVKIVNGELVEIPNNEILS